MKQKISTFYNTVMIELTMIEHHHTLEIESLQGIKRDQTTAWKTRPYISITLPGLNVISGLESP